MREEITRRKRSVVCRWLFIVVTGTWMRGDGEKDGLETYERVISIVSLGVVPNCLLMNYDRHPSLFPEKLASFDTYISLYLIHSIQE